MSQTPQNEKKSRFQLSREVQEEFVNGIAQAMLSLAENAEQSQPPVAETPFCPATGKEYSGANMVRLMLAGMEKGYADNRWLTFKQLQAVREEYPDLNIRIKKGEHGVTVLRPEDVFFTVEEDGKWNFVSEEQAKSIPDVQRHTLLYPFTVFNAAQIENFPAREQPAPVMREARRNELLERFVASSGVAVEHGKGVPRFDHKTDTVRAAAPGEFSQFRRLLRRQNAGVLQGYRSQVTGSPTACKGPNTQKLRLRGNAGGNVLHAGRGEIRPAHAGTRFCGTAQALEPDLFRRGIQGAFPGRLGSRAGADNPASV